MYPTTTTSTNNGGHLSNHPSSNNVKVTVVNGDHILPHVNLQPIIALGSSAPTKKSANCSSGPKSKPAMGLSVHPSKKIPQSCMRSLGQKYQNGETATTTLSRELNSTIPVSTTENICEVPNSNTLNNGTNSMTSKNGTIAINNGVVCGHGDLGDFGVLDRSSDTDNENSSKDNSLR